jgi:hypothetical protein
MIYRLLVRICPDGVVALELQKFAQRIKYYPVVVNY